MSGRARKRLSSRLAEEKALEEWTGIVGISVPPRLPAGMQPKQHIRGIHIDFYRDIDPDIDPAKVLAAVRDYFGVTREEYDAVAKRRSRKPLTAAEIEARQSVAGRVAGAFERYGGRRGAVGLACSAYGTNRVTLGRLRAEGRGRLR